MISEISVTCFAASYALALVLEAWRIGFRSQMRLAPILGIAAAGLFAHTLFLGHRAASASASPLSSPYDWYLLAAWSLAIVYLALSLSRRQEALGVFVLPLVLVLIGVAHLASDDPFAPDRASRLWGNVHGACLLLGTVAMAVGFIAGVMYFVQSYRLKHKLLPREGFRLPTLEWLERANRRSLLLSVVLTCFGFFAGVVLNVITAHARDQFVPWSDPVVWTSGLMVGWLLIAALFFWSYRAARRGRQVALLTVFSFLLLSVVLAVVIFGQSAHGPDSQSAAQSDLRVEEAAA